jgi:hypothetical protein
MSMSADPTSAPVGSTINVSLTESNMSGAPSASNASNSDASNSPGGATDHAPYADQADQQAAGVESTDASAAPTGGVGLAIVGVEQRVPDGMTFIGADNDGTYDPSTTPAPVPSAGSSEVVSRPAPV